MTDRMWGEVKLRVLWLLGLCLLTPDCHGNQFDPHLYPAAGPFFEGWYMRLVDRTQRISLGFLFGRVLPANGSISTTPSSGVFSTQDHRFSVRTQTYHRKEERPLVLAAILLQDSNVSQQLRPFQGCFPLQDYSVTVKGGPVVRNPDDRSPPDFAVQFGQNGTVEVKGGHSSVDVRLGSAVLSLRADDPVPWGPGGEGPEGWLEHLPLPLHWFVYSLRSTVRAYKFVDGETGRVIAGHGAQLHMEKNWGKSFPPAWIWVQAATDTNITWAVSGGIVDFDVLNVTAFLAGYRNPSKKITINFTPANSWVTFTHDGCQGKVNLTFTAWSYRVSMTVVSPPASLSRCLLGPEKTGFRPACVESYDAAVSIKAYRRRWLHYVLIDEVDIHQAALEFGGLYVCKQKCSGV